MKEELLKLALRVEALSGPERHVDADIAEALGWHQYSGANWIGPLGQIAVPSYTVSLDAAMTLVPKGWAWSVLDRRTTGYSKPNGQCWTKEDRSTLHGDAATPALALCAAALRALAKEE